MESRSSAETSDLRQELESLRAELTAAAPPEVIAAFTEATEDLVRSGIADHAIGAGEQAPDFTLPDLAGRPYQLSRAVSRGPLVLTFYRGAW